MRRKREEPAEGDETLSVGKDGWPDVEMFKGADSWEGTPWVPCYYHTDCLFCLRHRLDTKPKLVASQQLLMSAIDAASRIRAIAIEAFHHGIPVKWFEFDTTDDPSGGIPALQPLNSREVANVRSRVTSLLLTLALTVSNKESLVFWSPPTQLHPGVLFTADSDLSGISLPPKLPGAIATAPHHGSEANAKAYKTITNAFQQDPPSVTWVRSDGRYKNRPGKTYLNLSSRRLCTLCRVGSGWVSKKQAVHLFSQGGVWTRHQATVKCSCK
jgi:hypothetical protein